MTITMQQEDVARNLVDIVNSMESLRTESLRNFHASDEIKIKYLHMTSELASCMQDATREKDVGCYARRVEGFLDNELLLFFDPLQKHFWDEIEPEFPEALSDLSVVVLRENLVSERQAYHIYQGLKYLLADPDRRDLFYRSIQPFNNLLSDELLSKPEVARYVMENLFLGFIGLNPEGQGIELQETRLDTPEFVERLKHIGALFVDMPYSLFRQMRNSFPDVTVVGDGQDKKARVLFIPKPDSPGKNMFDFFSEHAAKDLGYAKKCMDNSIRNTYRFGKEFLKVMQEEMGITGNPENPANRKLSMPSKIAKDGDVYVISDVTLYRRDGSPYAEYPEIRLTAHPVSQDGSIAHRNQHSWIDYHKDKGTMMLSLPLLYAILEAAYDSKDEDITKELLQSLQSDIKASCLTMSTLFKYNKKAVWHNVSTQEEVRFDDVEIPGYNGTIERIIRSAYWKDPLRSMFMTGDLEKIPRVLGQFGEGPIIWVPHSDRAVQKWAVVRSYNRELVINCRNSPCEMHPNDNSCNYGRSREVTVKQA